MQDLDILSERKYWVNKVLYFIEMLLYFFLNVVWVFLLCSTSFAMFYSINKYDDMDFVIIVLQIISLVIVYSWILLWESLKAKFELIVWEISKVVSIWVKFIMTALIIITITFFWIRSIEVLSKTSIVPKTNITNMLWSTEVILVEQNRNIFEDWERLKSYAIWYSHYLVQYKKFIENRMTQ